MYFEKQNENYILLTDLRQQNEHDNMNNENKVKIIFLFA